MSEKKFFTVNEIRDKMAKYCAYQDRCHWEVETKFHEFHLIPEAKDEIIVYLIQHNFLNEERFVKSYVTGKFHQKKWGRIKIRTELKKRKIPAKLIEIGLKEIDEVDYIPTLHYWFERKKSELKSEKNAYIRKAKIRRFLLQKGFENDLIMDLPL